MAEGVGEGDEGGACGADVVDEEDVLVLQAVFVAQLEHVGDVLLTLATGELRLALAEVEAADGIGDEGNTGDVADAQGEMLALVVAALAKALAADGHGQQEVYAVEEPAELHLVSHQAPHVLADVRAVVVFHLVDQLSHLRMWLIVDERCGMADGGEVPEELHHGVVVRCKLEGGARQVQQAGRAERALCSRQSPAADHAQAW